MKYLIAAFLLLSSPAFAADEKLKSEVDPKLCAQMAEYRQPAGVSFEPGVDVHGKPVVEADLNPSPVQVPEEVVFLVSVDMAKYLGMNIPEGTEAFASMGAITYANGELFFNDEPLDGRAAAALRELCGIKRPVKPQPDQPQAKKDKKSKHNKD